MLAYIGRRLGALIIILFGSSFLLYNLDAYSADPTEGLRTSTDPRAHQQLLSLIRTLHLDVPPPARYFMWLKGVLGVFTGHFTLGLTRDQNQVSTYISHAIPVTIRLVTLSTVLAILFGIGLGIISALRQYSRFDYAMTFFAFLMYSLPIFWVAVLLKAYLAISFNNFLVNGTIAPLWIVSAAIVSGVFWAALISGTRQKVLMIFAIAGSATTVFLTLLSLTKWFTHPGLGPIMMVALGLGFAFGVTYLSTGLENKAALRSSVTVVLIGLVLYFPVEYLLTKFSNLLALFVMLLVTVAIATAVGSGFAKIDRRPVIRTSIFSSLFVGFLFIIDKLMKTWVPYVNSDAIHQRPIPTIGQVNDLLPEGNFWFSFLDIILHLVLPTIALILISMAGYIRYSRGTMLEVLNQDYIRTARAKGLSERTVVMRHAFRNTLIPITTIVVVDIAGIIGGAIITERVFGWRGMGTLFNTAINSYDLNLLMGVSLITSTMIILANLAADLAYSALDPRIRVVGKK
ncbi:MAG: ABC transporter permease [Actinomycetes bacterium]